MKETAAGTIDRIVNNRVMPFSFVTFILFKIKSNNLKQLKYDRSILNN